MRQIIAVQPLAMRLHLVCNQASLRRQSATMGTHNTGCIGLYEIRLLDFNFFVESRRPTNVERGLPSRRAVRSPRAMQAHSG